MRQAVMTSPGAIELREAAAPKPGEGKILLRIQRIGVCGSDVHVWHGTHPFTSYPVVQGHEYCGVVEDVGPGVSGVERGSWATARPQRVCGTCGPCRRGDYNVCEELRVEGFQAPGCAQDRFVVPIDRFVPLPAALTPEEGAMIEPFAVGAHSTARAGELAGKNVVVLGAGMIGNVVAQFCRARGAARVLITDINAHRLEIARKCGIEHVSQAAEESLADASRRVFGHAGFQVALEAAGSEEAVNAAIDGLEKGGRLVILGVFGQPPRVNMAFVCEHEITVAGSMMYKHEDYLEAVDMIARRKVVTEPLVTRHFPLEEYEAAYRYIDEHGREAMKVMIDL